MGPGPFWNRRARSASSKVRKRTRVVKQTSQAQHKGCIHPYVRAASKEWLACSYSFFRIIRSEEHTSELQSLMRISYAVFCLQKKKQSHSQQYTKAFYTEQTR